MGTNPLTKIVNWLRAGYPEGVPQGDYIALLGVLRRSLTEEEVEALVTDLYRRDPSKDQDVSEEQIRAAIRNRVHQEPSKEDVLRVLERIESGGWPFANPPLEPTAE